MSSNEKHSGGLDSFYGTTVWIAAVVMVIGIISIFVTGTHERGNIYSSPIDMSEGWTYYDGTPADLDSLVLSADDTERTIVHMIDSTTVNGRSLSFMSNNLNFDVQLNGRLIYSYHPSAPAITGKYYGKRFHVIHIPAFDGEQELSIVYTDLLAQPTWTKFMDMQLVYPDEVYSANLRQRVFSFLVSAMTFVFGFAMLLVGLLAGVNKNQTASLGAFAIVLSAWTGSQTGFIEFISNNGSLARFIEYTSLMILPIPCILYMAYMTHSEKSRRVLSVAIAGIADIYIQITAVLAFSVDYHDTVFMTHAVILYGVVVVISTCVKAVKNGLIDKIQKRYLMPALFIVICSGIIDLLIYYISPQSDAAVVSRSGLFLFVVILSAYELRQIISTNVSEKEIEVMKRIANTDALTGLLNRTAYNNFLDDLKKRRKGKYAFIHFDVNCLKQVNDTYGHEEGDIHLKAAANIISSAFGEYGSCYRIGGDEYVTVIEGNDCRELYNKGLEKFKQLQGKYNFANRPPVRMEIAQGMAVCDLARENFEQTQRNADQIMYEEKERLKRRH